MTEAKTAVDVYKRQVVGSASIFVNPVSLKIALSRIESIVIQRTYSWCTILNWFSQ